MAFRPWQLIAGGIAALAVLSKATPARARMISSGAFSMVPGGTVSSRYGCRPRPGLHGEERIGPCPAGQQFHLGVDIHAPVGTPVYAPAAGKVLKVAPKGTWTGYGNAMIVSHPELGVSTLYAHLSEFSLHAGDPVARGALIAKSGNTDVETSAPHVHFEVLQGSTFRGLKGYGTSHDGSGTPVPPRNEPLAWLLLQNVSPGKVSR